MRLLGAALSLILAAGTDASSVREVRTCIISRGDSEVLRYECPDGPTASNEREALVNEVLRLRVKSNYSPYTLSGSNMIQLSQ